jgi:uncharacterized membrane protein
MESDNLKRINSIDITRGLVMVIMALDHVRDFMHTTAMTQSPTDLHTTTTLLFMTRWITHLCAPTFVFLSGVSAYISFKRSNNLKASRSFLLKRGIWLLILEFTFINFALWFDIHFRLLIMEVISAIGLSFIVLSLLMKLKSRTIGIIGILIIFLHNLLQFVSIPQNPLVIAVSSVLFRPFMLQVTPGFSFYTAYPLVPWLGIMLAGFASGEFFSLESDKRNKILLRIGLSALLLFFVVRSINIYGDPSQWSYQKSAIFSILSFINVTKYPPSMLFTLLFLGITFIVLFLTEKAGNRITGILTVYGRVPLFYFVVHLFIIHGLMLVMLFIQGFSASDLVFGAFNNGRPKTGGGVGLATVYIIWVGVVALLYPVCKWYGKYKSEHRENELLRYL